MHAQLETLLQIQDLKAQRQELAEGETGRAVQQEEFHLDVETALEELRTKIEELESDLDPATRGRYDRLASAIGRVVVPAINGTCYGCFVSVPTSVASVPEGLRTCESCGRFLYFVP